MAYTEVKKTSYGSQVGSSFKGIGTGAFLFVAATALLWWNEGRAVHRSQDIKEVGKAAVHIDNISSLDASLNGQLVHANGTASTQDMLTDGMFNFSVNAIGLERKVEYYQWIENSHTETKEKLGGEKEEITTYTYERSWVSSPVNSSNFKDPEYRNVNSVITNVDDKSYYAENVSFGAYSLPDFMISSLAFNAPKANMVLDIDNETLSAMNSQLAGMIGTSVQGQALTDANAEYPFIHVSGNQVYLGRNSGVPAVGDVRISFSQTVASTEVSLIGVVNGNTFGKYKTKNNSNDYYLTIGTRSLDEMMQSAEESNTVVTWLLRILGLCLVCAALKLIFSILSTILKVVPFLANIMNWGVSLICNVVGFAWTLIVVALAWIFYRPLLGIALLVIAAAAVYFLAIKGKGKKPEVPAEAPQA